MLHDVTVHITPNLDGSFLVIGQHDGPRGRGTEPAHLLQRGRAARVLEWRPRYPHPRGLCGRGIREGRRDLLHSARDADGGADPRARPGANRTLRHKTAPGRDEETAKRLDPRR